MIAGATVSVVTASCNSAETSTLATDVAAADAPSGPDPNRIIVDAYERATGTHADPVEQRNYYAALEDCMSRAGFEYLSPADGASTHFDIDRVDYVGAHAYGVVERLDMPVGNDPNEAIVSSLTGAERVDYYLALLGADGERKTVDDRSGVEYQSYSGTGCIHESFDNLGLSMDEAMQNQAFLDVAFEEANAGVASDPTVLEAWNRWSQCMAAQGYQVETRSAARSLAHSYADDPNTLRIKEQQLAAADVDCDRQASVQDVLDNARSVHLGEFYEDNAEILERFIDS